MSQAFLARWFISGGYTDVSEVVVFMSVAKYTLKTNILSLSDKESVSCCELILQLDGITADLRHPSLIFYNTTGMMHLKIIVLMLKFMVHLVTTFP